jgi:hypothetical protein
MSMPPFGSASPSFGLKASKAKKPRMLILLVICIHDKALCIQLTNVQISFTELKSSLKSPRFASGTQELQMIKIIKSKSPHFVTGTQDFEMILNSKAKAPRFASGTQEFQMIRPPSGRISRAPLASLRGHKNFK